ncbi:MAG: response regulator [Pseudomonadota bacterium]
MPDVLVVDDNPTIREMLEDLLLVNGYTVDVAGHGRAALDLLEAGRVPRVILLDLRMPVMDGAQLLEHLRASPHACVPVVVRGSQVDEAGQADALAARFGCEVIGTGAGLLPVLEAVARHCGRELPVA